MPIIYFIVQQINLFFLRRANKPFKSIENHNLNLKIIRINHHWTRFLNCRVLYFLFEKCTIYWKNLWFICWNRDISSLPEECNMVRASLSHILVSFFLVLSKYKSELRDWIKRSKDLRALIQVSQLKVLKTIY